MRSILLLLSLSLMILITSCGDDDTNVQPVQEVADVNLTFKAKFGAQDLDFNTTTYNYEGMDMNISKFDFFISNVSLFKNVDGVKQETELFEIDFVDFTGNNNSVTIENTAIPIGEYDGIVFSIGVPSDLNNQLPGDFSSTHPLGFASLSHYWEGWSSYIFTKIEGRVDTSGNEDYLGFSYHTGSNDFYKNDIEKNLAIDLVLGATETINFEIDLEQIFLNGSALDIEMYPNSHSLSETTAAEHVVNNYPSSITVN